MRRRFFHPQNESLHRARRFFLWFWPLLLGGFYLSVGFWAIPVGVIPLTNNRGAFATMWATGTVAACLWTIFRRNDTIVIITSAYMYGIAFARVVAIVFVADLPYGQDIYFSLLWIVVASAVLSSCVLHLSALYKERLQEQADGRRDL